MSLSVEDTSFPGSLVSRKWLHLWKSCHVTSSQSLLLRQPRFCFNVFTWLQRSGEMNFDTCLVNISLRHELNAWIAHLTYLFRHWFVLYAYLSILHWDPSMRTSRIDWLKIVQATGSLTKKKRKCLCVWCVYVWCMCVSICVHVYMMCVHLCACMYGVCVFVCVCACVYDVCVCMHVCACVCMCI